MKSTDRMLATIANLKAENALLKKRLLAAVEKIADLDAELAKKDNVGGGLQAPE